MRKAGATGSCFWAIIVICDNMQSIRVFIGENVPGLRDHGRLEECRAAFALIGFVMAVFDLNPLQFEVPHDRPRIFFIAYRTSALRISPDAAVSFSLKMMSDLQQPRGKMHLSDYLAPASHPAHCRYIRECNAIPVGQSIRDHMDTVRKKRKNEDWTPWVVTHEAQTGKYPGSSSSFLPAEGQVATGSVACVERFPAIKKLPLRELDMLRMKAPFLPESPGRSLELSQSLGRHSASSDGEAKTLLPKGNVMHTGRVVPLLT